MKKLEEQVKARKERYNRAQPVFDMLKEWMDCWKQKLETERRVCRASFYKNRGGNLNQKLKVIVYLFSYYILQTFSNVSCLT